MEVLLFFAVMILFLVIVFIKEAAAAKKREKQFIKALYENFGKIPEKEYSGERFAHLGSFWKKHPKEGQIDDITWNDLGMDAIFKRMNYTFSASGEEYLYYILRTPKQSEEELAHFEEAITWFLSHKDERVKVQYLMSRLGHMGKYSLYDYIDNLDYLGKRSNLRHYLADALFIPFICLIPFDYALGLGAVAVLAVYNIVSYFKEKNEIDPYVTSFSYVMRLMLACDELLKIKIPVLNEEWKCLEVHRKRLEGIRRGSFWVLSGNRSAGTGNPLDLIMDYVRMTFHVDLMKFNSMLSNLKGHIEDVDALIEMTGYVETVIAAGAFRVSMEGKGVCVPEIGKQERFVLTDAYYPLLKEPVKNSICADRGVLLTGSNASGKSTFLKAAAVNAILAQTVHSCAAAAYSAPFFHIYSSMALRDDIQGGESYYIVEIKALKRILDAAQKSNARVLCFVDEVLRGTNTVERIAASTQILKSLCGSQILCFAATHDIEMTDLLKNYFDNYHFEEDISEGDLLFHYKLLPGKATTRNAIKLLEIMGYKEEIIQKAQQQAEIFTQKGIWMLT